MVYVGGVSAAPDFSRPPAKTHWTARFIHYRFIAFLFILGVFALVMFPRSADENKDDRKEAVLRPEEVEQQRRCLFNGTKIWRALNEFHETRGTDTEPYPADLRQMDPLGITDDMGSLLAVKPEFAGDWLYFSAADPENRAAPLLISPPLVVKDGRVGLKERLVVSVGGAVQMMTADEVEKQIASSPVPPIPVR